MRVDEVFNMALALANEESGDAYKPFVVGCVNQILADLRVLADAEEVPTLKAMSDVIPYPENLVRECIPYGLCVFLQMGDDELQKAGFFDNRYAQAQSLYAQSKGVELVKVVDVYA